MSNNQGISDVINNLYEKLILRDLLSFIAPGFIFWGVLFLAFCPFASHILIPNWSLTIILVLLLGAAVIFFVTGFFFQCLREFLQYFGEFVYTLCKKRWVRISLKKWNENLTKSHMEFLLVSQKDPVIRQQRERFVILKQMTGNTSMVLLIITVVFLLKYGIIFALLSFAPAFFLGYGFFLHNMRQNIFEGYIINNQGQLSKNIQGKGDRNGAK